MIQKLSPVASLLVKKFKLTESILKTIKGKGPQGLIMKSDILDYTHYKIQELKEEEQAIQVNESKQMGNKQNTREYEQIETNQNTSEYTPYDYLAFKQQIPHYHLNMTIRLEKLMDLQKKVSEQLGKQVGLEALIVKSVAKSLQQFPLMNSKYNGNSIKQYKHINMQVTEMNEKGVQTYQMKQAEQMCLMDIQQTLQHPCTHPPPNSTVHLQFIQGAQYVSDIIHFNHSCVITVHSPVTTLSHSLQLIQHFNINLGSDHRVVDGALAAAFLYHLQQLIEQPASLMLI